MAINADTLLERLYLKNQVARWRLLAIVLAVIAAVVILGRFSFFSPIEKPYVARLTIDGVIGDNRKLYKLIDELADNPRVKAVIVWLDTPGGSAVGGEEIYLHLRQLAAKKPVVAVMRSIAASAGYLVSLGADRIYASQGTITGSIGVLIETAEVTDLAAKIGIKPIIIKSAPLKGMPSPFEKDNPASDRMVQSVVNDFYAHFVDIVADRRHLPRNVALELSDGRIFSGERALQAKLVDAIGDEDAAMKWLVAEKHLAEGIKIRNVKLDDGGGLFDRLSQSIAGIFFEKSSLSLDGLVAIWHPALH